MSIQLINQYYAKVEKIYRYGGSKKETSIRKPFQDLLEQYARQKNLELIGELDFRTRTGHLVYPDGTLKDALRQDWGYWESKDEDDDLDREIANKFAKGYPQNNILFEDSKTAVLYQAGAEVGRVDILSAEALDNLLTRFVSYESREVREFREAIENFTRDIPDLGEMLRQAIRTQYEQNDKFKKAAQEFLELCQEAINPSMEMPDVREMIVQHVLTEDIFITVFDEPQFHRENIIAHELGTVVNTFYKGQVRRQIDAKIEGYTRAIKARAAQIYNHQEKQKFLKVLYENFYKAYNPKAADRLGIVYTPNEIVRFMIEAADHLCFKHFGKTLGDEGVEILDPATGTGTFITELIEYLPPHQLEHKYKHELHCNEVSILPYYIANLNIEYTYKQKMGQYEPFENIVFVDTLDNMGFKTGYVRQLGLFGLTDENSERIQKQNKRDISIIIGNPPYNANQLNENNNNKNREYPEIDKRIKNTYVKHSSAQKTNAYDMYTRFIRWASDRLGDKGIIAFVTNSSFVDAHGYDGFRKIAAEEFDCIYLVDMKGNARTSGERRRREGGNVFSDEIRVGVVISFFVKNNQEEGCRIYYNTIKDYVRSEEKKAYLRDNNLKNLKFENITPSKDYIWINQADNDWDDLIPIASKFKNSADPTSANAIFELYSNGVLTSRDEWVYDFSQEHLRFKMTFFLNEYNSEVDRWKKYKEARKYVDSSKESNPVVDDFLHERNVIKWSSRLKRDKLRKERKGEFDDKNIVKSVIRPFVEQHLYFEYIPIDVIGKNLEIFPSSEKTNYIISVNVGSPIASCLASKNPIHYATLVFGGGSTQCLPLYRYDDLGNRVDNITDWALGQFQQQYAATPTRPEGFSKPFGSPLDKQDIFHYVYAVLHHPAYREKYKLNLKREFPRIPFYDDFWQWAEWGQALMALHLTYETVEPFPLERHDIDPDDTRKAYKARLKADKESGVITLDTLTSLHGVPASAWTYKLGNRSAIEWILDRYKERKPRDPTIREKFNTYRFIDYKEQVIDLIRRVTTVSEETMRIVEQMDRVAPLIEESP